VNSPPNMVVLILALASCSCTRTFMPGPINAPSAQPIPQAPPYTSTLAASVYGTTAISGSVFKDGYHDSRSGSQSETVKISASKLGKENGECGNQWVQSRASSVSEFIPQNDPQTRTFGFSLIASIRARGGFYRGRTLGFCSGSHNVTGSAEATTGGRIDITFNASAPSISDRLIIRIHGNAAAAASIRIVDSEGKALTLNALSEGRGLVADLPKAGPYTLSASIHAQEAHSGACGGCQGASHREATVSVQSLRDALSLGYGDPVNPDFTIPLRIHLPIKELETELKKQIFTDSGRFYPCKKDSGDCGRYGRELYLESPSLLLDGAWTIAKVHLSGHGNAWLFRPGITGTIILSGVPTVENDTFSLKSVVLEVESRNFILNYLNQRFGDRLVELIEKNSTIDLNPHYEEAVAQIDQLFPLRWGPGYLDLDASQLKIKYLGVDPAKQEVIVELQIKIKYVDSTSLTSGEIETPMPPSNGKD
jgi:hypothetical protein